MKKKDRDKEFHILAEKEGEGILLEECKDDSKHEVPEATLKPMVQLKQGTNLNALPGPAYELEPAERPGHVKLKEIKLGKGPSKANSRKFRDGWESTFGAGGMKN